MGAKAGVCPQWHVQVSNYLGKDYFAEKEGDELVVTISVDDFSRTNAERARRKAMDEVSSLLAECKGLEVQVENTRRARSLAFAELERLEPGQTREREVKELVLESWDKTLEEVTPRLDAIRETLTKAEEELAVRVAVDAESRVVRLDLSCEF